MEQHYSMPTADTPSSSQIVWPLLVSRLHLYCQVELPSHQISTEIITDSHQLQDVQITEANAAHSTFEDLMVVEQFITTCIEMDSSLLYNLAISILGECKQATLNPDISTVVHLVDRALGPHPDSHLLRPNPLILVAKILCVKQNEGLADALPLSGGMINECAVLLSVILTCIFTNNLVDVLKESPRRVDVKNAVGLFRDGLKLLPIHHPYHLPACGSVANALYTDFEQSGEREGLDEAISLHRDALELFPAGHPDRSASLNNLGISLRTRFEQSGEREDLDEAISLHRDALELRPAGHPNRSSSLNNLGISLTVRFEQSGEREDLDD
ncbi:hypothetical protein PILCRDRAFT_188440, partial [Piloderma croceum F 1598]